MLRVVYANIPANIGPSSPRVCEESRRRVLFATGRRCTTAGCKETAVPPHLRHPRVACTTQASCSVAPVELSRTTHGQSHRAADDFAATARHPCTALGRIKIGDRVSATCAASRARGCALYVRGCLLSRFAFAALLLTRPRCQKSTCGRATPLPLWDADAVCDLATLSTDRSLTTQPPRHARQNYNTYVNAIHRPTPRDATHLDSFARPLSPPLPCLRPCSGAPVLGRRTHHHQRHDHSRPRSASATPL